MVKMLEVSREDLERRRAEILDRVGLTLNEITARASQGSLVAEEWEAWAALRDIAYLIGDDDRATA
jgi:hypothetical protein